MKTQLIITLVLLVQLSFAQNVGIATNDPQTELDVRGTIQVKRASSSAEPHLDLNSSNSGDGYARLKFSSEATGSDNYWLLAGRSYENESPSSRFNVYFNGDNGVTGNKLSLLGNGKLGIGVLPSDRLHVEADSAENAMRVRIDGYTKFRVLSNGGTTIGVNNTSGTPSNGLYVSGNTGLGVSNPAEKLAVNGNVDIMGEIKTNSMAGSAGQVLSPNGNGGMEWLDLCEFSNFRGFTSASTSNWTVPVDVDKICVEVWGAGGGGALGGAGGGGGYVKAILDVNAGQTFSVTVGGGGNGVSSGSTAQGGNGGNSTFSGNGATLTGNGGLGASSTNFGSGGGWASSSFVFIGINGTDGEKPGTKVAAVNGSLIYLEKDYGRGGHAANTNAFGGKGDIRTMAGTGTPASDDGTDGEQPGGGGGGGAYGDNDGGKGMIVIRW